MCTGTLLTPNRKGFSKKEHWFSLEQILNEFDLWIMENVIEYIKDLNTLDPWEQFQTFNDEFASSNDDEPYTDQEKEILKTKLIQFPEAFAKALYPNEKLEVLESKIETLNRNVKELISTLEVKPKKSLVRRFLFGIIFEQIVSSGIDQIPFDKIFGFIIGYFKDWQYLTPFNAPFIR